MRKKQKVAHEEPIWFDLPKDGFDGFEPWVVEHTAEEVPQGTAEALVEL